jgi:uncharacterized protein (DUF1015 family)
MSWAKNVKTFYKAKKYMDQTIGLGIVKFQPVHDRPSGKIKNGNQRIDGTADR